MPMQKPSCNDADRKRRFTGEDYVSEQTINKLLRVYVCATVGLFGLIFIIICYNDVCSTSICGNLSGFTGSYIGGAVGGIGTLLTVYITHGDTRKTQQDNIVQFEDEKRRNERKERKQFADEIRKDVAKYIRDITKYFQMSWQAENLEIKGRALNIKLCCIMSQMDDRYAGIQKIKLGKNTDEYNWLQLELAQLKEKKSDLRYKLEQNTRTCERNQVYRDVAYECLVLLQMKLKNIDGGEAILKQIDSIYNSKLFNMNELNEVGSETEKQQLSIKDKLKELEIETDNLSNMTAKFVEEYVNQKR